ncbi:uncharacterized protein LOC135848252 isoform X2 [Planococcus citri]
MAEISLDQDHVYDATQSTLLTLKELSAIAVALKIWHGQINKYRTIDELEVFIPRIRPPFLMVKNPDLPTVIDAMIRNYASKLGPSIDKWLREHHKRVLFFHYSHQNYILEDFDDFVCDYDGTIDYAKTAERMMRCDKFGDVEKFKIACTYFFEDDIRRLWPSIRKKIGLDCINFRDCPELYYWICCLRNESRIKINIARNSTVDEEMLDNCMPYNRPSVEYFWNRIPHRNQVGKAVRLLGFEMVNLTKFILPKFDTQQLDEFVNMHGRWVLILELLSLLECRWFDEKLIPQAWMRIRNVINEPNFTKLVVGMFGFCKDTLRAMMTGNWYHENLFHLCREIWYSAPQSSRRSAIEEISSNFWHIINRDLSSDSLLTVLTYATFEERSLFWSKCWPNLIECKNTQELQQIMEICFENGDAIIRYKENVMATSDHLRDLCDVLLSEPDFDKLNDSVNFCCPNEDAARLFKLQLLESKFLHENPVFRETYFGQAAKFNEFINDAYNNAALATNFKNHLMSLPIIQCFTAPERWCSKIEWSTQLIEFTEFIETFVSTEGELRRMKMLVIDHWKKNGFVVESAFDLSFSHEWSSSVDQFLLWCLGSDEEVGKFKQVDLLRFFLNSVEERTNELRLVTSDKCLPFVNQILFWCLGSDEEVGKFKQICARHLSNSDLDVKLT